MDTANRQICSRRHIFWMCWVVCAPLCSVVQAQVVTYSLPQSNVRPATYSRTTGLRIEVSTQWVGSTGYRPVECTASCATPVQSDTLITIRFYAGDDPSRAPAITAERQFELRQGQTTATMTLSVPQYFDWDYISFDTWIDGVHDAELSLDNSFFQGKRGTGICTMLLEGPAGPRGGRIGRVLGRMQGGPSDSVRNRDLESFQSWTHFSALDLVVADLQTLNRQKSLYPKQFAELLQWLHSGGNLWVLEADAQFEQLGEIEACLEIPAHATKQKNEIPGFLERGWRYATTGNPNSDPVDDLVYMLQPLSTAPDSKPEVDELGAPSDSRKWFVVRPYGFGLVTVFRDLPRRGEESDEVAWVLSQSLVADRLQWNTRHGNDPGTGNDSFSNFLIPDVGTAPVTAFQVLLSLFVLVIGPLNYLVLSRRDQLPYLLLTVPAAALTTIALLVGYSFLSDGLSSLVRVRSLTLLDQHNGSATTWARRSYFTGLRPQRMAIPTDTVLYPIHPSGRSGSRRMTRQMVTEPREVVWSGGQQLTAGWLAARTPTQYLSIASRATTRRLEIEPQDPGFGVTNLLGTPIEVLVVEDMSGEVYLAEQIPEGSAVQLTPSTHVKAMMKLRTLFSGNAPQFPPGILETLSFDGRLIQLPLTENLMENQFTAITSALTKTWGHGSYIAVTQMGVDLDLGVDGVEENESFHVVKGSW